MPDNVSSIVLSVAGTLTTSSVAGPVAVSHPADITDVVAVVGTAPTDADLVFDVLKNGTSIFAAPLGTIALDSAMGTTDTALYFEVADNASLDIRSGQVLLVGTEALLVTAVHASAKVDGPNPVYKLTVTRGYDGTSAATHAVGVAVYPAKPSILDGETQSSLVENGVLGNTPSLDAGDVLTLTVLQVGSTIAGADLSVTLELDQR